MPAPHHGVGAARRDKQWAISRPAFSGLVHLVRRWTARVVKALRSAASPHQCPTRTHSRLFFVRHVTEVIFRLRGLVPGMYITASDMMVGRCKPRLHGRHND